jgi:hypothetical protein
VTPSNTAGLTLSGALTFTSGNWGTAQSVTYEAPEGTIGTSNY